VENEKKVLVIERRRNEEEFAQRHREDEGRKYFGKMERKPGNER